MQERIALTYFVRNVHFFIHQTDILFADTTSVKSAPEVSVDSSSSENSKDSEPANKASENPDTSEGSSSDNGSSNKRSV